MKNSDQALPFHGLAQKSTQPPFTDYTPFATSTSYHNFTGRNVTIGLRNGLKVVIPKETGKIAMNTDALFMIRVTYTLKAEIKEQLIATMSGVYAEESPELFLIKEMVATTISTRGYWNEISIVMEYIVTLEELIAYQKSVYFHQVDIVVSLLDEGMPDHPYSERNVAERVARESGAVKLLEQNQATFAYGIMIVDNQQRLNKRYINIQGIVYRVDPVVDATKKDGVWLTTNGTIDEELPVGETKGIYYELAEAEKKLGLYKTYEEALTCGDQTLITKREATEREMELTLEKNRLLTIKNDFEIAAAEREAKIKELEDRCKMSALELAAKQKMFELENDTFKLQQKNYYDKINQDRKNNGEVIKILPTIIVGIGACIVAFRSWRASAT